MLLLLAALVLLEQQFGLAVVKPTPVVAEYAKFGCLDIDAQTFGPICLHQVSTYLAQCCP